MKIPLEYSKKSEDKWISNRKSFLKEIKNWEKRKDADRLELLIQLSVIHKRLVESVDGWGNWIQNPYVMSSLNKEQLNELLKKYSDLVKKYIEMDIEYTKIIGELFQTSQDFKEYFDVREEGEDKGLYRV